MSELDRLLAEADPTKRESPMSAQEIRETSRTARDVAEALPWWRRRRVALPVAGLSLIALTAGAIAVPLALRINDQSVHVDVTIPISYVTETGRTISCEYGIYVGTPDNRTDADEEAIAFLKSADWSGIGQEIYEEALANPYVPGPNDDWESDSQEVRDRFSFNQATDIIIARVSAEVNGLSSLGSTSTCTGELR